MKLSSAIGGGIAGAVGLTLIHETVRRLNADAPRMDVLGMQALAKSLKSAGGEVPDKKRLFKITMAGDFVTNSLYYSLAGFANEQQAVSLGVILGLAAGAGAVYLPKTLGLSDAPASRTLQTKMMTVALYLAGGLIAGIAAKLIENKTR